jgi:6-phosphofructokinase 2
MREILTVTPNPALDIASVTAQVRATSKLRCDHVQRHPGGGGVNVARVLQRLGAHAVALYTEGGASGQSLSEMMDAEGVARQTIAIAGQTRETFTVQEQSTGQEYRFVLEGPALAATEWQALLAAVAQQPVRPDFVVASGSLPPGVPDDFYAQLARAVHAMPARLVLDTSGTALALALEAGVFLVKPSLRELRELTGRPLPCLADVRDTAAELVAQGKAEHVAVSLGARGALLVSAREAWFAPPLEVPVVSAVGAGDSFVAGLVWGVAAQQDLPSAFATAVACASASLLSRGSGLCAPSDVERLLRQVHITAKLPDLVL